MARSARLDRLLRRAKPAADGVARLGSRQVYILPTASGLVFGMLLTALLFAAINYGNNLIFALTFLLAGVGHAALLQTWRNLAGLGVEVGAAEAVFAGQDLRFPVRLTTGTSLARDALRLGFSGQPEVLADVATASAAWLQVSHATGHRGILTPSKLIVSTRFPLGLFRAWSIVEAGVQALVYPKPVDGFPLPTETSAAGRGGRQGRDGQEDFAGLRGYRPGDAPQRISWKALARTGELHTKDFDGESVALRWLDWDAALGANSHANRGADAESDTERCLGILAAWVEEAANGDEPWGLRLPGISLGPDRGAAFRRLCLEQLARFGEAP